MWNRAVRWSFSLAGSFLSCGILWAQGGNPSDLQDRPVNLTVVYTGGLYGYYRDDALTFNDNRALVGHFIQQYGGNDKPLVLGMGDNFGPEFGASIQEERRDVKGPNATTGGCELEVKEVEGFPQALYKDDRRVATNARCDNVGHFLLKAGYRALVPGREDFRYGSGWLRAMAFNLRIASGLENGPEAGKASSTSESDAEGQPTNSDHQLVLLAANVRLKLKVQDKATNFCPLLFSKRILLGKDDKDALATCSDQTSGQPPELLDVLDRMTEVLSQPEMLQTLNTQASYPDKQTEKNASQITERRNQLLVNQLDQLRLMAWGIKNNETLLGNIANLKKRLNGTAPVSPRFDEMVGICKAVAQLSNSDGNQNECLTPIQQKAPEPGTSGNCTPPTLTEIGEVGDLKAFANGLLRVLGAACKTRDITGKQLIVDPDARKKGVQALLRAIAGEQEGFGYTVTSLGDKQGKQLIIGIMGESTLNDVSLANRSFCLANPTPQAKREADEFVYCDNRTRDRDQLKGNNSGRVEADVYVVDPVKTIVALMRAAKLKDPAIDSVIVMAQMSHTEAEELGAALHSALVEARLAGRHAQEQVPPIAFLLSKAESDHASGEVVELAYSESVQPPVMTPRQPYITTAEECDVVEISGQECSSPRPPLLADSSSVVTYSSFALGAKANVNITDDKRVKLESKAVQYLVHNQESDGNGVNSPEAAVRASVLLAEKLMGVPEKGDSDPPSPYGNIQLGSKGHPLTVADLLLGAGCLIKTVDGSLKAPAVNTASQRCNLAILRLLMEMLAKGARRENAANQWINPAGEMSDMAMLEERDIWLGALPKGYASPHALCTRWIADKDSVAEQICELRVAEDMAVWKGDYAVRVEAKGSDITEMLTTAQKLSAGEGSLTTHDVFWAWLATFGLVQRGAKNLTTAIPSGTSFWIPDSGECADNDNAPAKSQAGGGASAGQNSPTYCVNGKTIQPDASYWVVTSDHLAKDNPEYGTLSKLPSEYEFDTRCYLTEKISQAFDAQANLPVVPCFGRHLDQAELEKVKRQMEKRVRSAVPPLNVMSIASPKKDNLGLDLSLAEDTYQRRQMFHMDFGKIVAGFDTRVAVNGDGYVAGNFQGVTDSRASAPSQREIDFEQQMRGYIRWRKAPEHILGSEYRLGIQTDLEFDRSTQGNLSGKAENPSFPLNSLTGGLFFEMHILRADSTQFVSNGLKWFPLTRMKPARFSLVAAPLQYQRQIVGNYLYFPFTSSTDGAGPKNNSELTVPTEPAYGWVERLGLREAATTPTKGSHFYWDSGSYWEFGIQYLDQRQVLQAFTINTPDGAAGATTNTCYASGPESFATCFKTTTVNNKSAPFTIDGKSTFSNLTYANPTEYGLYWDISLQKQLTQATNQIHKVSLLLSSKGDRLIASHLPLSTETRYDAPLSTGVAFQLLPNLSVSPTYNGFWYNNQVLHGHLFINEGLITLRWYYDRDSAVPFWPLFRFGGPSSNDQTKSMHMSKGGPGQ